MPRTSRAAITLAEEQPRTRRHRVVGWLVVAVVAAGVVFAAYLGGRHLYQSFQSPRCQATTAGTTVTLTPEQMSNAATIVGIASKRGLPARAGTIGVTTAIQESKLRNLEYGDRDSVGLFQQRPSQGWGTVDQLLDTEYSTNRFYDALVKIDGWQTMEITKIAQKVQRSAAPEAYADHEQEGRVLADTLSGYTTAAVTCTLDPAKGAGDPAAYLTMLTRELGRTGTRSGHTVTVGAQDARRAWATGQWSVAKAEELGITAVTVGDREWRRGEGSSARSWHAAKDPIKATSVRVTFATA
ncbi:conserved exported hypothetical protein [Nostocoides japonicum T1-X7]|uniref:Uncharacterized protein n=1 Tax=Nostocoides japonicum T1-X7 TaxID=1194083 RepID=A0A077M0D8_9MICO|nr:hypothetical protein [Tetrasphaera japonica]CCH77675.1 conserved exported hypothetical protein [Tetrasphaera japonica T1-X7]